MPCLAKHYFLFCFLVFILWTLCSFDGTAMVECTCMQKIGSAFSLFHFESQLSKAYHRDTRDSSSVEQGLPQGYKVLIVITFRTCD